MVVESRYNLGMEENFRVVEHHSGMKDPIDRTTLTLWTQH